MKSIIFKSFIKPTICNCFLFAGMVKYLECFVFRAASGCIFQSRCRNLRVGRNQTFADQHTCESNNQNKQGMRDMQCSMELTRNEKSAKFFPPMTPNSPSYQSIYCDCWPNFRGQNVRFNSQPSNINCLLPRLFNIFFSSSVLRYVHKNNGTTKQNETIMKKNN